MKSFVRLAVIILAMLPAVCFAQTTKKAGWPELKAFHALMSGTFHPAEEGNFKPLIEKADSLYIVAKLWQDSKIPDGFKPEETKATLAKLVNQCLNIQGAVKANAAEEKLNVLITDAHDIFHKIVEECRKKD